MKNILFGGTSVLLSTFLLVGCGAGACCEDGVEVLSNVQQKSTVSVENTNSATIEERSETTEFIVPNIPPYAIAHADDSLEMIKISTCQTVHFDADSSYDPDGNDQNLSYLWSNKHSLIVSDERSFNHRYDKKGLYEMTLIVVDEDNLTAIDRVCVLVNMDEDELPLIAKAGGNLEVNSNEKVSLSGRGFCRDDILKYEWKEGTNILSSEAGFESSFETGKHTLLFTIEDFEGNRATDSIVINVL
jgi:PKD repeat protein